MKKLIALIVILVIAVCGYLYSTPYLALNNMKTAFEEKDMTTLNSYINFPSLRQSIKEQLTTLMMSELNKKSEKQGVEQGAEMLGSMLATTMVDKMVDNIVTPEMISKAVEQGDIKIDELGAITGKPPQQPSDAPTKSADREDEQPKVDYSTHYVSINRFAVEVFETKDPTKKATVIMERDGLDWQITGVELPLDQLK